MPNTEPISVPPFPPIGLQAAAALGLSIPSGFVSAQAINIESLWEEEDTPFNSYLNLYKGRKKEDMTTEFYNKKLFQVCNFRNGTQEGLLGLEIECEGTKLFDKPFKYWTCHADGSLRSKDGQPPVEYVLRQPVDYETLMKALNYLSAKLKESGSVIADSPRTSVHVHINCQQELVRDIYTFICLYIIFEELLVEWSGPNRVGNLFCLRAKDSDVYVDMLETTLKVKNFKAWTDNVRYAACNISSLPKYGSLEFRSLRGTVDVETIDTWVSLLLHLKEKASKYGSPLEIVEEFNKIGPLPFYKKIMDNERFSSLFDHYSNLSGKLWDGLRISRDIAYSSEWKAPEKKKEPPEEELQNQTRYIRANDVINVGGIPRVVNAFHRPISDGDDSYDDSYTFNVCDNSGDDSYYELTIPPDATLYYVPHRINDESIWLKLDIRDGGPENA